MRARTVLLGNDVRDTWYQEAEMEGLGAAVPAMEDSRTIDAQSLRPGYACYAADAESAYQQAWLGGKYEVWVEIPEEYWLPGWEGKYTHPCCRLILALYGHEDSGGYWEEKSYADIVRCGWERVEGRRGVFLHKPKQATLMCYVDDFKIACRVADHKELWGELGKYIRFSKIALVERYLGCYTQRFEAKLSEFAPLMRTLPCQWSRLNAKGEKRTEPEPWKPKKPDLKVTGIVYDMSQYLSLSLIHI